MAEVSKPPVIM